MPARPKSVRLTAKRAATPARKSSSERGYTWAWQKAIKAWKAADPDRLLCGACLERGLYVPMHAVDHVVPHKGDAARFWDQSNWRALCEACHNAKSARETGPAAPAQNPA